MKSMLNKFWNDEAGLELVEYAVMGALVVSALILAIGALSGAIGDRFGELETTIDGIQ
jgi:Flp pilus assembly pilin Flp